MSRDAMHPIRPNRPRWTHIALRVGDVEQSIAWYEAYTPLRVLQRSTDDFGRGAWLADPEGESFPFVLALSYFAPETDPFGHAPPTVLGPYAHLGFEVPSREQVDSVAALARAEGTLTFGPAQMPPPIGYICFVEDPDGNTIEFSFDQGTFATIEEKWGKRS